MKTSHQTQALPKAQRSTAEGGSMHVQSCCLWLKLQPSFSWTENTCSQVPLSKEEGEEGRGGCVSVGWSQHPPLPAQACIPEHARQDALVGRGDVKHGIGDEGPFNTSKQGWIQQWDVHGTFFHAMHSTLNLVSSSN